MAASMAASSSLFNNLCNLQYALTQIPTHLASSKPKSLTLKTQNRTSLPFSLLSISNCGRYSSAFDSFQVTENRQEDEEEEDEEEEYEEQNVSESSEDGRLYVGNLPYSMTSSQLAEIFGEAGRVITVEIVYDRVTDRSRGFGFITMDTVQEAKEAIRLFDGSQIGGRTVKVNFPEVPRGGERAVMGPAIKTSYQGFVDSPHKLYAGNLGWGLTSQGLRDAFADQPGLLTAKVIYDRDSGRSRGFGFISFQTAQDAQSALNAMNGVELEGRPLRLNVAAERGPKASSPATGKNMENSSELISSIST